MMTLPRPDQDLAGTLKALLLERISGATTRSDACSREVGSRQGVCPSRWAAART